MLMMTASLTGMASTNSPSTFWICKMTAGLAYSRLSIAGVHRKSTQPIFDDLMVVNFFQIIEIRSRNLLGHGYKIAMAGFRRWPWKSSLVWFHPYAKFENKIHGYFMVWRFHFSFSLLNCTGFPEIQLLWHILFTTANKNLDSFGGCFG